MTFSSCRQASRSLSRRGTLASLLTVSCRCSLSSHVAALCRSGFYHLRQLRPLCRSLPAEATKTLVQAFISCCNSLLYGVTDKLMRQVQSLQNAAARLITGTKRREHITSILRQLYWLPVRRRVEFEIAILVYIPSAVKQSTYLSD